MSKSFTHKNESIPSIYNLTPMNYTKIKVSVKIISDIVSFKTGFHQFLNSYDNVCSDLLHNVLHNHREEIFLVKMNVYY